MVIADVTATGDENPLDGRSNDLAYRKEQLRRMQEEVILLDVLLCRLFSLLHFERVFTWAASSRSHCFVGAPNGRIIPEL